ncbi:MAG: hypothetical protein HQL24_07905 [Candidatus Omnitrophica bacterium]|nr:hypothetical protein [Candidatus Omnitrophota bacterium]
MENVLPKRQKNFFIKIVSTILSITFISTTVIPPSYAQVLNLPQPGSMVGLTPAFMPTLIKGLKVHPENPLLFDFILDTGKSGIGVNTPEFKSESEKLIKYFLASMTIKESDLWVNLSPYEKNRIATDELGKTELGKDMLAQDYILKQLTASLMYPEKEIGKDFWNKVYAEAKQKFGTTDIPVDTFNKVWIVADKAKIFEHNDAAYVVGAHLKVMLEKDYLAANQSDLSSRAQTRDPGSKNGLLDSRFRGNDRRVAGNDIKGAKSDISTSIIKEVIIPAIEKEVNEGKNFATLRQMFYSMILATWYKQALKDALLNQVYSDKAKIGGVTTNDPNIKEKIYAQYLEAFKKGAYNYIKEEYDPATQQVTPKKYFSGGLEIGVGKVLARQAIETPETDSAMAPNGDMAMVTTKVDQAKATKSNEKNNLTELKQQLAAAQVTLGKLAMNLQDRLAFQKAYYDWVLADRVEDAIKERMEKTRARIEKLQNKIRQQKKSDRAMMTEDEQSIVNKIQSMFEEILSETDPRAGGVITYLGRGSFVFDSSFQDEIEQALIPIAKENLNDVEIALNVIMRGVRYDFARYIPRHGYENEQTVFRVNLDDAKQLVKNPQLLKKSIDDWKKGIRRQYPKDKRWDPLAYAVRIENARKKVEIDYAMTVDVDKLTLDKTKSTTHEYALNDGTNKFTLRFTQIKSDYAAILIQDDKTIGQTIYLSDFPRLSNGQYDWKTVVRAIIEEDVEGELSTSVDILSQSPSYESPFMPKKDSTVEELSAPVEPAKPLVNETEERTKAFKAFTQKTVIIINALQTVMSANLLGGNTQKNSDILADLNRFQTTLMEAERSVGNAEQHKAAMAELKRFSSEILSKYKESMSKEQYGEMKLLLENADKAMSVGSVLLELGAFAGILALYLVLAIQPGSVSRDVYSRLTSPQNTVIQSTTQSADILQTYIDRMNADLQVELAKKTPDSVKVADLKAGIAKLQTLADSVASLREGQIDQAMMADLKPMFETINAQNSPSLHGQPWVAVQALLAKYGVKEITQQEFDANLSTLKTDNYYIQKQDALYDILFGQAAKNIHQKQVKNIKLVLSHFENLPDDKKNPSAVSYMGAFSGQRFYQVKPEDSFNVDAILIDVLVLAEQSDNDVLWLPTKGKLTHNNGIVRELRNSYGITVDATTRGTKLKDIVTALYNSAEMKAPVKKTDLATQLENVFEAAQIEVTAKGKYFTNAEISPVNQYIRDQKVPAFIDAMKALRAQGRSSRTDAELTDLVTLLDSLIKQLVTDNKFTASDMQTVKDLAMLTNNFLKKGQSSKGKVKPGPKVISLSKSLILAIKDLTDEELNGFLSQFGGNQKDSMMQFINAIKQMDSNKEEDAWKVILNLHWTEEDLTQFNQQFYSILQKNKKLMTKISSEWSGNIFARSSIGIGLGLAMVAIFHANTFAQMNIAALQPDTLFMEGVGTMVIGLILGYLPRPKLFKKAANQYLEKFLLDNTNAYITISAKKPGAITQVPADKNSEELADAATEAFKERLKDWIKERYNDGNWFEGLSRAADRIYDYGDFSLTQASPIWDNGSVKYKVVLNKDNAMSTRREFIGDVAGGGLTLMLAALGISAATVTSLPGWYAGTAGDYSSYGVFSSPYNLWSQNFQNIIVRFPVDAAGKKFKIRFLPTGQDPNSPTGLLSKVYTIGANGTVTIPMSDVNSALPNHPLLDQISLHYGYIVWTGDDLGTPVPANLATQASIEGAASGVLMPIIRTNIFQDPTRYKATIASDGELLIPGPFKTNGDIELYNLKGQVVRREHVNKGSSGLRFSGLTSGTYSLRFHKVDRAMMSSEREEYNARVILGVSYMADILSSVVNEGKPLVTLMLKEKPEDKGLQADMKAMQEIEKALKLSQQWLEEFKNKDITPADFDRFEQSFLQITSSIDKAMSVDENSWGHLIPRTLLSVAALASVIWMFGIPFVTPGHLDTPKQKSQIIQIKIGDTGDVLQQDINLMNAQLQAELNKDPRSVKVAELKAALTSMRTLRESVMQLKEGRIDDKAMMAGNSIFIKFIAAAAVSLFASLPILSAEQSIQMPTTVNDAVLRQYIEDFKKEADKNPGSAESKKLQLMLEHMDALHKSIVQLRLTQGPRIDRAMVTGESEEKEPESTKLDLLNLMRQAIDNGPETTIKPIMSSVPVSQVEQLIVKKESTLAQLTGSGLYKMEVALRSKLNGKSLGFDREKFEADPDVVQLKKQTYFGAWAGPETAGSNPRRLLLVLTMDPALVDRDLTKAQNVMGTAANIMKKYIYTADKAMLGMKPETAKAVQSLVNEFLAGNPKKGPVTAKDFAMTAKITKEMLKPIRLLTAEQFYKLTNELSSDEKAMVLDLVKGIKAMKPRNEKALIKKMAQLHWSAADLEKYGEKLATLLKENPQIFIRLTNLGKQKAGNFKASIAGATLGPLAIVGAAGMIWATIDHLMNHYHPEVEFIQGAQIFPFVLAAAYLFTGGLLLKAADNYRKNSSIVSENDTLKKFLNVSEGQAIFFASNEETKEQLQKMLGKRLASWLEDKSLSGEELNSAVENVLTFADFSINKTPIIVDGLTKYRVELNPTADQAMTTEEAKQNITTLVSEFTALVNEPTFYQDREDLRPHNQLKEMFANVTTKIQSANNKSDWKSIAQTLSGDWDTTMDLINNLSHESLKGPEQFDYFRKRSLKDQLRKTFRKIVAQTWQAASIDQAMMAKGESANGPFVIVEKETRKTPTVELLNLITTALEERSVGMHWWWSTSTGNNSEEVDKEKLAKKIANALIEFKVSAKDMPVAVQMVASHLRSKGVVVKGSLGDMYDSVDTFKPARGVDPDDINLVISSKDNFTAALNKYKQSKTTRGSIQNIAQDAFLKAVAAVKNASKSGTIDDVKTRNLAIKKLKQAIDKIKTDKAMSADMKNPGGIDLNAKNLQMNISKDGKGVEFKFDAKMVEQFKRGDFTGVVPVIIRITPISSPFPLLGLEIPTEQAIEITKKG